MTTRLLRGCQQMSRHALRVAETGAAAVRAGAGATAIAAGAAVREAPVVIVNMKVRIG